MKPQQTEMFEYPRHSATSKAAAMAIRDDVNKLQADVLRALRLCQGYGATDQELQIVLSMSESTERPRRGELVTAGLVVDSGRTRTTISGRKATVWKVVT